MASKSKYDLNGVQLWPTMFFTRSWEHHDRECSDLRSYLVNLRGSAPKSIASDVAVGAKSAMGIYESDFDLFKRDHPSLRNLVSFIESSLATAASVANRQEVEPSQILVSFVESWFHIANQGGYHDAHFHHGCSWCGIYYLQVGTSGSRVGNSAPNGGSRFYSPHIVGGGYRDYGNKYLTESIDAAIEDGMLLIFPSYLLHSGLPYSGDIDRIVIAFNAQIHLKSRQSGTTATTG